jgi:hypothetical protein
MIVSATLAKHPQFPPVGTHVGLFFVGLVRVNSFQQVSCSNCLLIASANSALADELTSGGGCIPSAPSTTITPRIFCNPTTFFSASTTGTFVC